MQLSCAEMSALVTVPGVIPATVIANDPTASLPAGTWREANASFGVPLR